MEQISKKTFFSFAVMDSLYWAFYACFVGFITTYLLTCGMDNAVLSIMLACFMGASFIGAFFWGSICDKAKTNGYISKMVNSRNRINEKIIFLHVSNTEEICDLMHSFLD